MALQNKWPYKIGSLSNFEVYNRWLYKLGGLRNQDTRGRLTYRLTDAEENRHTDGARD